MAESTASGAERDAEEVRWDRHRELRDIFVAITGSEKFTETQEQQLASRYLVAEESLSEPVTAIAKADGLADTFSDLEYTSDSE